MRLAITEAEKGRYHTYRNPLVGAVIVNDNQIIATGYHRRYGDKHAERMAIDNCKTPEKLKNSTLYVTLEPCAHFGKQPPCVNAVIESGIQKVVVGQFDPNPLVHGKGIQILKDHGIEVVGPVLESASRALNEHYNFFYQHHRPFVTLKQAISMNGQITAAPDQRTAVTANEVNQLVHHERMDYQAILVGAQTVMVDDPLLLPSGEVDFPPTRIILDRGGRLKNYLENQIFKTAGPVVIFSDQLADVTLPEHVQVVKPADFEIKTITKTIGELGIQSIYVEGGQHVNSQFLNAGEYDEMITYVAPKLFPKAGLPMVHLDHSVALRFKSVEQVGPDLRIVSEQVK
ncbi:bifunctional diaminohydroxyphosphoribosylaminopyrimidine deaminase/5-amino-6-(5-phosphoribosylamino)uracil reductase RibD [Lactobacillus sp. Sy-1]|nr:bifunctional diaminohydroxyphosphoribosylaminopyrimidine deaminase/5-amino-6-(5-phosphoribosylamino)uracil reductase RibD [Lactobacillus sp. Sy-1]